MIFLGSPRVLEGFQANSLVFLATLSALLWANLVDFKKMGKLDFISQVARKAQL